MVDLNALPIVDPPQALIEFSPSSLEFVCGIQYPEVLPRFKNSTMYMQFASSPLPSGHSEAPFCEDPNERLFTIKTLWQGLRFQDNVVLVISSATIMKCVHETEANPPRPREFSWNEWSSGTRMVPAHSDAENVPNIYGTSWLLKEHPADKVSGNLVTLYLDDFGQPAAYKHKTARDLGLLKEKNLSHISVYAVGLGHLFKEGNVEATMIGRRYALKVKLDHEF